MTATRFHLVSRFFHHPSSSSHILFIGANPLETAVLRAVMVHGVRHLPDTSTCPQKPIKPTSDIISDAGTHDDAMASSIAFTVRVTLSSGISAVMLSRSTRTPKTCHLVSKPPSNQHFLPCGSNPSSCHTAACTRWNALATLATQTRGKSSR